MGDSAARNIVGPMQEQDFATKLFHIYVSKEMTERSSHFATLQRIFIFEFEFEYHLPNS